MLGVFDIKIKGVYIFSQNFNADGNQFCDRVDELNAERVESENRKKAQQYIKEFRENFKKPDYMKSLGKHIPFLKKLRQEISPFYQVLKWYLKPQVNQINYWESVGPTLDYKPPRIILRDHYCRKWYTRFSNNYNYYPFENLGKFVYFPLQVQPEASLDVTAPFFNNQIEMARLTAMSLPDDYVLVVKDHPAMLGLRNPSYLKKIDKTPNIKLIDYRISSEKVLKRADLVISPNSTTLAEAAFLNKPAIQFGNLATTLKLPNVFKYTDISTLNIAIKEVLSKNLNTENYERGLENYVAAAYDTGFSVDYIAAWEQGKQELQEPLWQVYKKEFERLLKYE